MLFNKKTHDDMIPEPTKVAVRPDPAIAANKQRRPDGTATRSVIDPWLRITGNLEGEAELQIDGHIRGDIRCTKLVISKGATVDGNVTADEVVIRGRVIGVVRGNRVVLQEGAYVENEICYKRLCIEEEAHFEGIVRMRDNPLEELATVAAEMKAAIAPKEAKAKTDEAWTAADDAEPLAQAETDLNTNGVKGPSETLAGGTDGAAVATPLADADAKRMRAQLRGNRPA
jgi:cytoskeletal protein CcmA (bactofilin family)